MLKFKDPDYETITIMIRHLLKHTQNTFHHQIMMGLIPYVISNKNIRQQISGFFEDQDDSKTTKFSEKVEYQKPILYMPKLTNKLY